MKQAHTTIVLLFFAIAFLFLATVAIAETPDGADLYIEAIRCRFANHTLVHSMQYVTEQTYRMPTRSEEEIEKEADDLEDQIRRALKDDPNAHLWLDGTRDAVHKHYMQASIISRFTVKYKAPSFVRKLLSLQIERACTGSAKWETETNIIEANVTSQKSESEGVVWLPQGNSARVNNTQSYMETLLNFGRLQGPPVLLTLVMLFNDSDAEKYEFSKESIARFKEEREKQLQARQSSTLVTVGTATYDGDARAYVVESSTDGRVTERYWIDASKGYICPLIQYYDETGKIFSEYKSRDYFLHEKSGLWFPQIYEEMTTDRSGQQQFKEYRIDKSSVDINFSLTDDEFAVEIPDGAEVIDERKDKKLRRYVAMRNGVLSLGHRGLDLERQDWLLLIDMPNKIQIRFVFVRVLLLIVGALLMALGLYYQFYRKSQIVQ
ncbi:MAG: hypothetical protein ACRC46_13830 [Thermoguttaceae bacterium]